MRMRRPGQSDVHIICAQQWNDRIKFQRSPAECSVISAYGHTTHLATHSPTHHVCALVRPADFLTLPPLWPPSRTDQKRIQNLLPSWKRLCSFAHWALRRIISAEKTEGKMTAQMMAKKASGRGGFVTVEPRVSPFNAVMLDSVVTSGGTHTQKKGRRGAAI